MNDICSKMIMGELLLHTMKSLGPSRPSSTQTQGASPGQSVGHMDVGCDLGKNAPEA